MEFTSLVDTSLDLNFRPLRVSDELPVCGKRYNFFFVLNIIILMWWFDFSLQKQEVESNFIGLGRDLVPVKDEVGKIFIFSDLCSLITMSDPEFEVYTIVLCCFVQASNLIEELNRVNAENKKLTEMLTVMCQNYNSLRNQLTEYMSKQNSSTSGADQDQNSDGSKKIKIENNNNNNNNNEIFLIQQE